MPTYKLDSPNLSADQKAILSFFNIGDMALAWNDETKDWEQRGLILSPVILEHAWDSVLIQCEMLYYPEKKKFPFIVRVAVREKGRKTMMWKSEKTLLNRLQNHWRTIKNDG